MTEFQLQQLLYKSTQSHDFQEFPTFAACMPCILEDPVREYRLLFLFSHLQVLDHLHQMYIQVGNQPFLALHSYVWHEQNQPACCMLCRLNNVFGSVNLVCSSLVGDAKETIAFHEMLDGMKPSARHCETFAFVITQSMHQSIPSTILYNYRIKSHCTKLVASS